MNVMRIDRPGMFSTIQDLGRRGEQSYGVPVAGAMDATAHRVANALVGNDANAATLEVTLTGPSVRFAQNTLIAMTGAHFHATVEGRVIPMNRAVVIRAGHSLDIGERRHGARLYLAVRGGFGTPPVLGSRSTYVRGAFGGHLGRALRAHDRVPMAPAGPMTTLERLLVQSGLPTTQAAAIDLGTLGHDAPAPSDSDTPDTTPAPVPIRILRGPQWRAFSVMTRKQFGATAFVVSSQSDRMGYRLSGPPLLLTKPLEMISEAVNIGTIQVPPDGQPIILMADRQTAGGYPKLGYVIAADLSALAQALPGDALCFRPVTSRQAEAAYWHVEDELDRIVAAAAHTLT